VTSVFKPVTLSSHKFIVRMTIVGVNHRPDLLSYLTWSFMLYVSIFITTCYNCDHISLLSLSTCVIYSGFCSIWPTCLRNGSFEDSLLVHRPLLSNVIAIQRMCNNISPLGLKSTENSQYCLCLMTQQMVYCDAVHLTPF